MDMMPYLAEFIGTMMLILLGDGVVANVNLNKSGMKGAGPIQITFAWGLAVLVPAFIFGAASGAHFNPALTIALAVGSQWSGGFTGWEVVPGYIVAQFAGAFLGACLVWLLFKKHFEDETLTPDQMRGVFCTAPSIRNIPLNILSEAIGTFVLVFAILGIGNVGGANLEVAGSAVATVTNPDVGGKFLVFAIIVSIGMSLGGLTGYAINPARDIGPRLAHQVLPIKGKGSSDWQYAIVTAIGPVLGALAAMGLFLVLPW